MNIIRNIIRYTIGLPLLIVGSFILFVLYVCDIGENSSLEELIFNLKEDLWKFRK